MSLVATAELRTCLPSFAPPMNIYSKFPLAQLVVLRGGGTSLDKRTIDTIRNLFTSYPQTPARNKCKSVYCSFQSGMGSVARRSLLDLEKTRRTPQI
ncbi:hypothetical protein E2C01_047807 [Portunus trituberculatus]|uniref:Uncharacterized protein n=1 Tax=Portunus trituberculatus TaxID=210409 RepID=A0A5B7GBI3_PORTR|nr:hypothetical protein [Portunus trituberculatus]